MPNRTMPSYTGPRRAWDVGEKRRVLMSALPPKADIRAGDHYHSRRRDQMPCDCARESAAKKEIVSLLFFVCAVRDKPGFLKAPFRKSGVMIGVDQTTDHAVFRCVLENQLKLKFLGRVIHWQFPS